MRRQRSHKPRHESIAAQSIAEQRELDKARKDGEAAGAKLGKAVGEAIAKSIPINEAVVMTKAELRAMRRAARKAKKEAVTESGKDDGRDEEGHARRKKDKVHQVVCETMVVSDGDEVRVYTDYHDGTAPKEAVVKKGSYIRLRVTLEV